ncbi:hypothetical protein KCU93_g4385, partial [Aureobasidium melanogenum]
MPPKGSRRIEVVTLTDEPNKKPRLDLEEQIKRAATLAAQLQNGVKDDDESKSAAATQIATEELMRIFKSMQEKTNDASLSFEGLVQAQIKTEVNRMVDYLRSSHSYKSSALGVEIDQFLTNQAVIAETKSQITLHAQKEMEDVTSGDYVAKIKELVREALRKKFIEGVSENRSATHILRPQVILTVINKMSKPVQADKPTKSSSTEVSKQPHLDPQEQIQRAVALATQIRHAAGKDHLSSTEWTANQAAANELLRIFENMQEKTNNAAESIEGLITTQIKLEVKMKMDKLQSRSSSSDLYWEIRNYLAPTDPERRERIVNTALEKMRGVTCVDFAVKVSEAVESAIFEQFHKGIDKQLRDYMQ